MSKLLSLLADPAFRAGLTADLESTPSPRTQALVTFLTRAFGSSTLAIIHYGSHAQRSDARPESAHDFFIIVERYTPAYRSLQATIGTSYRPIVATLLSHILPPNVIALPDRNAHPPLQAKCAVLSLRHFRRACSAHAQDHFTQGRLFQHVQLLWTRDPESRAAVINALAETRARTFDWGRSYLPPQFDLATYCRVLLETSFAAEIRPEERQRTDTLLAAQTESLHHVYAELLQHLADKRILGSHGKVYTDPKPPGPWAKFCANMYFRRSKWRATLRWSKYIALYDDWLEYLLRKIARRSDISVELTARERRWPLIFLWPKAFHYLRTRPQRRAPE